MGQYFSSHFCEQCQHEGQPQTQISSYQRVEACKCFPRCAEKVTTVYYCSNNHHWTEEANKWENASSELGAMAPKYAIGQLVRLRGCPQISKYNQKVVSIYVDHGDFRYNLTYNPNVTWHLGLLEVNLTEVKEQSDPAKLISSPSN